MAQELHDDFGQRTALLEMQAEMLSRMIETSEEARGTLDAMRREISQLYAGIRSISHQLHPSILQDLGLVVGLQSLAESFVQAGMDVSLESNIAHVELPIRSATALYRIAQEALNNAAKHSNSAPVHMCLELSSGMLQLSIADAGPGFDLAVARSKGLGLLSMHERAHMVGGTMLFTSVLGQGTKIVIRIPRESALTAGSCN